MKRSYILCAADGIATFTDIIDYRGWTGPALTIFVFRPQYDGKEWA